MQGFPFDSYLTWDEETHLPSYDRGVSSKPLRNLIGQLFTTGVMPNPSNNLQVHAGTDGMTVVVSPGFAVIEGGLCLEENSRTLAITASDPQFDRIDTVVVRWNENDSVRTADLHVVQGTPARNPIRPTLTREGSIYEIGIADIFVTKGVTTITNEKITDTRMESARCGIVSSVSEWDTTTIYQQIQSELANFKSDEEVAFENWFDYMKDQLTEDAAGKLQTEVDDVRGQIHTNLLNPALETTTITGVKCTNNGDGTYTLNGTASANIWFVFAKNVELESKKYRWTAINELISGLGVDVIGVAKNGGARTILATDFGNGADFTADPDTYSFEFRVYVPKNTALNNVVFKPMLTTDLSATYNDYVPYSGDGRLNENVAEIYKEVEEHETRLDSAETTIGNHTSTLATHTSEIAQINADLSDINTRISANALTKTYEMVKNVEYVAPSDGYFKIGFTTNGLPSGEYVYGYINEILMNEIDVPSGSPTTFHNRSMYVKKGMRLKFDGSTHAGASFYSI
jgi:hypothetical protein